MAEAVTLAHYGRVATLSRVLPPDEYEVIVAADPRYRALDEIAEAAFHPLWSIPSAQFARALDRGAPLYDAATLTRYVEADLALLDAVRPDLVVGDFRLSLAISAPLRACTYASIVNAYWSPYAELDYPVPELPFTRITGLRIGQALFDAVRPFAFGMHARPFNRVRRRYGLPPLGNDLRHTYTWADHTLYADIPDLVRTRNLPANHRFLGPVFWSTQTALPGWWADLPRERPVVFLTLGSSGRAGLLPRVLDALAELPVTVVAATAGGTAPARLPANAFAADYLPMDVATVNCALVISNGGSLTTYRALAMGVPVLGLCSNMDQLLNMNAVAALGAGIALRAGRANAAEIRAAVRALLDAPRYREAAERAGQAVRQHDAGREFRAFVGEVLGDPGARAAERPRGERTG
ncbi:MAG TPA: glycosyl transferase family 1 [Thiobacillaceae bacterium]|nr:glycosyl transferase family 1 [Thiobacillaceae bacterium]